ncbi:MAG: glycine--tRNA ligase subunit beta [bacterium]
MSAKKKTKTQNPNINALLEIGCEEIPARFMPGFLADLKKQAEEKLTRERLTFTSIETVGTYHRLTLFIEGLAKKQPDLSQEIKGPPAKIAFAGDRPTPAALGFAKKQGVGAEQLIVKNDGNQDYVYAQVFRKGLAAEKVLVELFPEIINSLYQPLAMRWGDLDYKFIRPIHWIVALCGTKIVKFELAGVKSGDMTKGHRFQKGRTGLVPVRLPAATLSSYKKTMTKMGVIVDHKERRSLIEKQALAAAKKAQAELVLDPNLLDEVTFLVENPIAYVGSFDNTFLNVPQDVLITSMKKNQKYFPLVNKQGHLLPKFVVITDGCQFKSVVEGNEKVLSARLSDAKFFFDEDKKTHLRDRIADLQQVGFFEKLGTMAEKCERLVRLTNWLGQRLKTPAPELLRAKRVAELCKADLTTKMVYEFPELQGVMGREYALRSGEDSKVAQGISEHYYPRFAEDKLPQSPAGTLVALADRIDTLVGCFAVGAIPTGSVDPYGLRRAANGLIRLVTENDLDFLLDETFAQALKNYPANLHQAGTKVIQQLVDFVAQRLKPLLLDNGLRHDIVEASLSQFNDILDTVLKAKLLNGLVIEPWFAGIVASADRVSRIAKSSQQSEVNEKLLQDEAEKQLYDLSLKINWEVGEAEKKEDWPTTVKALAKLTGPLEKFFNEVLVMHEDPAVKANRLALLKSLDNLYLRVADFKKVVIGGNDK